MLRSIINILLSALIISSVSRRRPEDRAQLTNNLCFGQLKPKSGILRTLLVDYGSFIGALLGAAGALAAGGMAWLGVQEQIRYQKQGNNFSELVALQGEIDRLYIKLRLVSIISNSHFKIFAARRLPPFELTQRVDDGRKVLESHLKLAVQPIVELRQDYEKGSAGLLGANWIKRIEQCDRALKIIAEKPPQEKITYEWYSNVETSDPNKIGLFDMLFGPSGADFLSDHLKKCFDKDLEASEEIQRSQHEIERQIAAIERRSNKIRNDYED